MNRARSAQDGRAGGKSMWRVWLVPRTEKGTHGPAQALAEGARGLSCGSGLCDCNQGRGCQHRTSRGRAPGWLVLVAFVAYAVLIAYAWHDLVAWLNGEPPVVTGGER